MTCVDGIRATADSYGPLKRTRRCVSRVGIPQSIEPDNPSTNRCACRREYHVVDRTGAGDLARASKWPGHAQRPRNVARPTDSAAITERERHQCAWWEVAKLERE